MESDPKETMKEELNSWLQLAHVILGIDDEAISAWSSVMTQSARGKINDRIVFDTTPSGPTLTL